MRTELLKAQHVTKYFPLKGGRGEVHAVDDVSFSLRRKETLGVVGESGCGKSTLARVLLRLIEPTSGKIYMDGVDLSKLAPRSLRAKRKEMQIVFQDAYASLDSRQNTLILRRLCRQFLDRIPAEGVSHALFCREIFRIQRIHRKAAAFIHDALKLCRDAKLKNPRNIFLKNPAPLTWSDAIFMINDVSCVPLCEPGGNEFLESNLNRALVSLRLVTIILRKVVEPLADGIEQICA